MLGHLDIVPIGEGWTKDPFSCTEEDGYLFGRGVLDDKGPAMAGFYAMKMLKDNHIKIAGGIPNAVKAVKQNLPLSIKVEVETTTLEEVQQAIDAGADIIMLDNMSNETMAEAVKLIASRAKTEASGNMSIPRLQGVAATGVDYISVGALTHSVTALDISMNIKMN